MAQVKMAVWGFAVVSVLCFMGILARTICTLPQLTAPSGRIILTFRDRLRSDNALRDAYAALKLDLAARFPRDREAYIAARNHS